MSTPLDLSCSRCGNRYPLDHYTNACPACRPVSANLAVAYSEGHLAAFEPERTSGPDSIWRYDHSLPVSAAQAVTLGEGRTPLIELNGIGELTGIAQLYGKAEYANPTGSFKDRFASVAVSVARSLFDARVVATASSGNAGAAAAAYAARAGIGCVVFALSGSPPAMLAQIQAYGAALILLNDPNDRWRLVEAGVRQHGWFPTSPFFGPAAGSNPFGIEGYKSLAYEIVEQLGGEPPDWVVFPVCYGDALVGMWRGLTELKDLGLIDRLPRMVAAEIHGSLSQALRQASDAPPVMETRPTAAISIAAAQSTYQALSVLRQSDGTAIAVPENALLEWRAKLAEVEGIFVELSSAAAIAAAAMLRDKGSIGADDRVAVILTASGLKDIVVATSAGAATVGDASLEGVVAFARDRYGIQLD